jgi:hypothetical protein
MSHIPSYSVHTLKMFCTGTRYSILQYHSIEIRAEFGYTAPSHAEGCTLVLLERHQDLYVTMLVDQRWEPSLRKSANSPGPNISKHLCNHLSVEPWSLCVRSLPTVFRGCSAKSYHQLPGMTYKQQHLGHETRAARWWEWGKEASAVSFWCQQSQLTRFSNFARLELNGLGFWDPRATFVWVIHSSTCQYTSWSSHPIIFQSIDYRHSWSITMKSSAPQSTLRHGNAARFSSSSVRRYRRVPRLSRPPIGTWLWRRPMGARWAMEAMFSFKMRFQLLQKGCFHCFEISLSFNQRWKLPFINVAPHSFSLLFANSSFCLIIRNFGQHYRYHQNFTDEWQFNPYSRCYWWVRCRPGRWVRCAALTCLAASLTRFFQSTEIALLLAVWDVISQEQRN